MITPVLLADSPAAAGTPRLNFREGYCNLCEQCMAVCPTGALVPTGKDTIRLGVAQIDESTCVAFKRSGCRICVEKCPEKAIEAVKSNKLVIDLGRCNGCGLCENVCP
ncbi:MAG TPA: 4Fe-4S dicluster domain-containing protein, partial [Chloroflexota bacterium]